MPDRITELKAALQEKVDEVDRISASFKVGEEATGRPDGVVVSTEQHEALTKAVSEGEDIKNLIALEEKAAGLHDFLSEPEPGSPAALAATSPAATLPQPELKTLGEAFTNSTEWKRFRDNGGGRSKYTMDEDWQIEGKDLGSMWMGVQSPAMGVEQKDVYTRMVTAPTPIGMVRPEREPLVARQFRTSRVRDLFPVQRTGGNAIEYFKVSGFTNNAATVPERSGSAYGVKPQSAISFESALAPVRLIAHFEVAHRTILADEPQLQGVINNELLYGLRLEEDEQVLSGDGTGENLLGVLNTPGIQLYDANDSGVPATDQQADAVRRAATKVLLAYYEPTGVVLHPYDWENIELLKDAQDRYLLTTAVAVGAAQTLWRMPVVDTPAMPEGTFLTGAFGLGANLYDREQANIRVAEQHADFFIRNAVVILAEQRLALTVKRPESFVKGTFKV